MAASSPTYTTTLPGRCLPTPDYPWSWRLLVGDQITLNPQLPKPSGLVGLMTHCVFGDGGMHTISNG
jgi:hypothetical protein